MGARTRGWHCIIEERKKRVIKMALDDLPMHVIVARANISRSAVYHICKTAGVPIARFGLGTLYQRLQERA